jgi:hypothetical protein
MSGIIYAWGDSEYDGTEGQAELAIEIAAPFLAENRADLEDFAAKVGPVCMDALAPHGYVVDSGMFSPFDLELATTDSEATGALIREAEQPCGNKYWDVRDTVLRYRRLMGDENHLETEVERAAKTLADTERRRDESSEMLPLIGLSILGVAGVISVAGGASKYYEPRQKQPQTTTRR